MESKGIVSFDFTVSHDDFKIERQKPKKKTNKLLNLPHIVAMESNMHTFVQMRATSDKKIIND